MALGVACSNSSGFCYTGLQKEGPEKQDLALYVLKHNLFELSRPLAYNYF
jgi:hypothetical protein